ncbi:protein MKS1 [Mercurialis annua]|uniref:protein MKS1 n=1 Tax=Mercurialis annua TaxID=3986 RepID=UPI00215E0458|nr:protein MKS1 [Mercurialis annua]
MDPYYFPTTSNQQPPFPPPQPPPPQKKQNQIQGPRPSALKVRQDSHKIKKPPLPPPQQPVIIYAVSPKIIHTKESEFMAVVQRLTGLSSGDFSTGDGQVSPAARLAATERVSPRERSNVISNNPDDGRGGGDFDLLGMIEGVEIGQFPGVLSPAPAMLPPVPPGFFSPVIDQSFFNDMMFNSPYGNSSGFIVSPTGLLPASNNILSPLASPDIFHLLMEF